MSEMKKYLNRDGLEEYNSLLPHSSGEMQEYVNDWLDAHPEATTTVQDGAITEPKLADKSVSLRTLADDTVHMLKGMLITREISDNVLAADDAYSAPPVSLDIAGKSTQDGTPTPDAPVEINSIEQILLHASADGTTDAPNWPILLNLTQALRSLPNGTKDTLALSYLRPSDRPGWAWYSREVTRYVGTKLIDGSVAGLVRLWGTYAANTRAYMPDRNREILRTTNPDTLLCDKFPSAAFSTFDVTSTDFKVAPYYGTYGPFFQIPDTSLTSDALVNAWFSEHPTTLQYVLTTPIVTQLTPIDLPVIPAPNCTVWADPSTGLQMRYVRDTNLVIQRIEEAIADQ